MRENGQVCLSSFLAYRRFWPCVSQELAADLSRQTKSTDQSTEHHVFSTTNNNTTKPQTTTNLVQQ